MKTKILLFAMIAFSLATTKVDAQNWLLLGNGGTVDGTNFIGTTDNIPFNVRVNNQKAGRIDHLKFNAFWGYQAGNANTTGNFNVAIGQEALKSITTGSSNVAVGFRALQLNVAGFNNTAFGTNALSSNTVGGNSAFGTNALLNNTTGIKNSAFGDGALYSNSTGTKNTAMGSLSLFANTTGSNNTAYGNTTLYNSSTGYNNTAIGDSSLFANTTGYDNTGIGRTALFKNISGISNIGVGSNSLKQNTTGSGNTAVGVGALSGNISGLNNVAVGILSMISNTTGSSNTCIGTSANTGSSNLTSVTSLGNAAVSNISNKIRIGSTTISVIEGQVGFTTPSDGRFKENITEEVIGLEFIEKLRPVVYNFNTKKFEEFLTKNMTEDIRKQHLEGKDFAPSTAIRQSGFIAQEVEKAAEKAGYDFNGLHKPLDENDNYGLAYAEFVVPLVKAVQEQQEMIEALRAESIEKETAYAKQDEVIKTLQEQVTKLLAVNTSNNIGASVDVSLSDKNIVVLEQNVPNPFADQTTINYFLPENSNRSEINFHDQSGKTIKTVVLADKGNGFLNVFASDLSSGIYSYSLVIDGKVIETKKMVKTK